MLGGGRRLCQSSKASPSPSRVPLPASIARSPPLVLVLFSQSVYARQSFVNGQARLGAPTQRQIFTLKGKDLWDM